MWALGIGVVNLAVFKFFSRDGGFSGGECTGEMSYSLGLWWARLDFSLVRLTGWLMVVSDLLAGLLRLMVLLLHSVTSVRWFVCVCTCTESFTDSWLFSRRSSSTLALCKLCFYTHTERGNSKNTARLQWLSLEHCRSTHTQHSASPIDAIYDKYNVKIRTSGSQINQSTENWLMPSVHLTVPARQSLSWHIFA